MEMKKVISIVLIVCLALVLVACGTATRQPDENAVQDQREPAVDEEIVLRFGHVLAPTHPYNLGAQRFKELLEANAPQPVRVEIFHSAQLGSERDLTEGLQLGTVDIAIAPGTIVGFEPMMGVLDLPFIFRDREHAHKVLDGEIGDDLAANLPAMGLRLLSYWENGFRHVTNSRAPINRLEDLRGLKIRVPENSIYVSAFNEWGANVTTMAFGELFTALQQGTIDAQENPLAIIYTNAFHEVQDYLSLTGHFYGPAQVLISENVWQNLSPEMQDAIQDAAHEARDYQRQLLKDLEDEFIERLLEKGMQINEVDTSLFVKSAEKVWDLHRDRFGDFIERILNTR